MLSDVHTWSTHLLLILLRNHTWELHCYATTNDDNDKHNDGDDDDNKNGNNGNDNNDDNDNKDDDDTF